MKTFKKAVVIIGVCLLSLFPVSSVSASEQGLEQIAKMYEKSVVDTLEWNFEFYPDDTYYESKSSADFLSEPYSGSSYYFKYYYNEDRDELVQALFESSTDRFRAYVLYKSDRIYTSMYIR